MKLVISLASRGRPQQLLDTIQKDIATFSQPNTVLMVQVDADDQSTIMMLRNMALDKRVQVSVKPREDTIAGKWNRALEEPADLYMIKGDDDPLTGTEVDGKLLKAASVFPDGLGMVYGHYANLSFPGVMCLTAKMTEKLGYLMPEHFPYWFCDHWTDDVARMIGRISFADVRTDQSQAKPTQECREPFWWATWFDAAAVYRHEEANGIIAVLKDEPWRKAMHKANQPWIDMRSRMINDGVRQNARQLEWMTGQPLSLKDERYQRVKEKAIACVPAMLTLMENKAEAAKYGEILDPSPVVPALPRAIGAI
jgi:hypothetical protein